MSEATRFAGSEFSVVLSYGVRGHLPGVRGHRESRHPRVTFPRMREAKNTRGEPVGARLNLQPVVLGVRNGCKPRDFLPGIPLGATAGGLATESVGLVDIYRMGAFVSPAWR